MRRGVIMTLAASLLLAGNARAEITPAQFPALINTIISAESSGRPSVSGDQGKARGLMQITEPVWKQYTRLPFDRAFDAGWNRKVGEAHVRRIIERYGPRASRALVIYTYNTGRFLKAGESLPLWTKHHPNDIYRRLFRGEVRR